MSAKSEQAKKASLDEAAKAVATAAVTGPRTLIRDGSVVSNDFVALTDEAPPPANGKVIVSLARWQKDADALKTLTAGVRLPNTADVATAWPLLKDRPLLVLEFPTFADGRAYSQARLLREACGYSGEIRATGAAVIRDQLLGMARSGINAFELRADQQPQSCLASFQELGLSYQSTPNTPQQPVSHLRGKAPANRG